MICKKHLPHCSKIFIVLIFLKYRFEAKQIDQSESVPETCCPGLYRGFCDVVEPDEPEANKIIRTARVNQDQYCKTGYRHIFVRKIYPGKI